MTTQTTPEKKDIADMTDAEAFVEFAGRYSEFAALHANRYHDVDGNWFDQVVGQSRDPEDAERVEELVDGLGGEYRLTAETSKTSWSAIFPSDYTEE